MLVLNEALIKKIYSMKDCLKDTEQAFRYYQLKQTKAPVRMSVSYPEMKAETLYMPSFIEAEKYMSVKVVSIFPKNAEEGRDVLQSVLLLTDAVTGEHKAIMGASYLTVLRTGASSGAATKYLSRKNSKILAVIGCGAQSIGQIQAVMSVREINEIILYNRTSGKAEALREILLELYPGCQVYIERNPDAAVHRADIVNCSTKSSVPLFNGDIIKPGTHINAIGSYLPHMQEVDSKTLKKSSKIVVDTIEGVLQEAGDFLIPIANNEWQPQSIYGEISEIICSEKPVRTDEDEITFYKSVGIGYLDTMAAISIYKKAIKSGLIQEINL
ncbi:ornithine cyclodeaminase family protein [Metabacillus sp. JX24]|uniref:ornithine cyclodeaminase family protein n=1 Tax=Metabacillus sp. JX24 TaxID=3240759 RepID=UPI003510C37E